MAPEDTRIKTLIWLALRFIRGGNLAQAQAQSLLLRGHRELPGLRHEVMAQSKRNRLGTLLYIQFD